MSITGSGEGDTGYDAFDMGRLLNTLKLLQNYSKGRIDPTAIIAEWDIAKTIVGNRIHSVKNGVLADVHNSPYANYAARGFRAWGFDVDPAFGINMDADTVEVQLTLLDALSQSEPLGAEPHVFEGVELGHSPFSRLAGDVLYEMQLKRYRETGHFVCVSEGPLDHEPWFSYQGYMVLSESDPWKVEMVGNNPRFQTEGFRLANEVVSTKSAFMWAALRPQDYSRRLLDYVRARTRIADLGFSPGIYSVTGKAMKNYSDLNTNGAILEAIAYIAGGRTPLHLQAMRS